MNSFTTSALDVGEWSSFPLGRYTLGKRRIKWETGWVPQPI